PAPPRGPASAAPVHPPRANSAGLRDLVPREARRGLDGCQESGSQLLGSSLVTFCDHTFSPGHWIDSDHITLSLPLSQGHYPFSARAPRDHGPGTRPSQPSGTLAAPDVPCLD